MLFIVFRVFLCFYSLLTFTKTYYQVPCMVSDTVAIQQAIQHFLLTNRNQSLPQLQKQSMMDRVWHSSSILAQWEKYPVIFPHQAEEHFYQIHGDKKKMFNLLLNLMEASRHVEPQENSSNHEGKVPCDRHMVAIIQISMISLYSLIN